MRQVFIDEAVPEDPLAAQVVLHVRRHLRDAIHRRADRANEDLAHFFGFARADGDDDDWKKAARERDPVQAGAAAAARRRGTNGGVVQLGRDDAHLAECRQWLLARKRSDATFRFFHGADTETLLELSRARDFARATLMGHDGKVRPLPILIQGPTGSGKEVLACAIHELGKSTAGGRFEVVHVAGMTVDMLNDELFGHVQGAYTGAVRERKGRLELAKNGTLLIDEVGDLPPEAQMRLLRFLQHQTFSRQGDNEEHHVNARVIAATWHDLDKKVEEKTFREDLLHRLRVGSGLFLSPLSARDDVFTDVVDAMLVDRKHDAKPPIAKSARQALAFYEWPGNMRQLSGTLDEAVALAHGETLRLEHLPPPIQQNYLTQPVHVRALAFLGDEVDGQVLTGDVVAWRIGQVKDSLETTPATPNAQLTQLSGFLTLVDDGTDEHRAASDEVRQRLELATREAALSGMLEFWRQLAELTRTEPLIAEHVAAEVSRALEEASALRAALETIQKASVIDGYPWLRLVQELREVPLLKNAKPGEVARLVVIVLAGLRAFVPEVMEDIRADVKEGGLALIHDKLRKGVARVLEEVFADSP